MADLYRVDPIATPKGAVIRIKSFEVVDGGTPGPRPGTPDRASWIVDFGRSNGPTGAGCKRIETLVSKSFYHLQKIAMVASLGSLFDSAPP